MCIGDVTRSLASGMIQKADGALACQLMNEPFGVIRHRDMCTYTCICMYIYICICTAIKHLTATDDVGLHCWVAGPLYDASSATLSMIDLMLSPHWLGNRSKAHNSRIGERMVRVGV